MCRLFLGLSLDKVLPLLGSDQTRLQFLGKES